MLKRYTVGTDEGGQSGWVTPSVKSKYIINTEEIVL